MTKHAPDPDDPAVVATDAYLDALADDLPAGPEQLDRMLTTWRDDVRGQR